MRGSPAAVSFQGKLYVFYCAHDGLSIKYITMSNDSWDAEKEVTGEHVAVFGYEAPSPVVYEGGIYLFYMSSGAPMLKYIFMDGENGTWSADRRDYVHKDIREFHGSPSTVMFPDKMFVCWRKDSDLFYSILQFGEERDTWRYPKQVPGVQLSESPSAVADGGMVHVLHQEHGDTGRLRVVSFDFNNWSQPLTMEGPLLGGSPSAIMDGSRFHVMHSGGRGRFSNGELWWYQHDR